MKTFRQLRESTAKTAVITFGRFNPPTIGHQKMVDALIMHAKRNHADPYVFASGSQDAKKNPLEYTEKMDIMQKMFKNNHYNLFKYASKKLPTIMHVASELYADGYQELIMVVGSDRVGQFKKLLPDYNGVEGKAHGYYNFDKITIESAGERDPDADGAEGMSASKMRQFVIDGDYDSFSEGIPNTLVEQDKRKLYQLLRKRMRLSVIESIIYKKKNVKVDKKDNLQLEHLQTLDDFVDYFHGLPYNRNEEVYINKIISHISDLKESTNYNQAKQHIKKIKSYTFILDEQSGMIDYNIVDTAILDKMLCNFKCPEYKLKPLHEGEFENAVGAIALGLAAKYGYDKLIKQKFSRKEKIKSLQDKIDDLKDQRLNMVGRPVDKQRIAKRINDLEAQIAKEKQDIDDLNDRIAQEKEKKKEK